MMSRASHAVLSLLLALVMASAAIPASAAHNLLQNPGFETGFDQWEYHGEGTWGVEITSAGHTGDYAVRVWAGEGIGVLWQEINPPQRVASLEFWYRGEAIGDGKIGCGYDHSDGIEHLVVVTPPPNKDDWTFFHIDLDTTKVVETVLVWVKLEGSIEVDDFNLGAADDIPLKATVNFDPDTLNLKSKGNWVTVYVEVPVGYDASKIDIASIGFQVGASTSLPVATGAPSIMGDYDHDGRPDLMVKFDRKQVQQLFSAPGVYTVVITGTVAGVPLSGTDTVRVTK